MLWGKKSIEFSVADTKAIVQDALPQLEIKLGQPIYLTSTGIIPHDQLVREATELLTKGHEETSLDLMSFDLDVSRQALQAALDDVKCSRVYFGSTVLPQPVVEAKLDELRKVQDPISAVEYCKRANISMKFLEWLCREADFVIVEGVLLQNAMFTRAKQDFLQDLKSQTSPVELSTLVPEKTLLSVLLSVNANSQEIPGSIDKTSLVYTPRAYVEAQRRGALDLLKQKGHISVEELAKYSVKDHAKFARKNNLVYVKGYVLTPDYVSAQKHIVKTLLDEKGYVFIEDDIDLGSTIVEVLDVSPRYSTGFTRFFVNPSFENRLKDRITADASERGENEALKVSVAAGEEINNLVGQVSGKAYTLRDIEQRLDDLPEKLQKQIAPRISARARQAFIDSATRVLQTKLDEAQKQVDLKLGVYLNGVFSLEEPLRAVVFKEWQQYLSDCNCPPVTDIEAAKDRYVDGASEQELAASAAQIVASQQRKLQVTTEPAMVLHLAVVIWHAEHHVPSKAGVLRIRGKIVPKILKSFEFPESFNLLKKAVISGESAEELVLEVKHTTGNA